MTLKMRAPDETEKKTGPDRGYFVDVKTLAAAPTSRSHSLASSSELLKVPTQKKESDEHGGALTPDYVRYGLRDVQTTWECFDHLARRFASFRLHETGLYGLKASQEVQRGFLLHLVGAIMCAYFGGRAEESTSGDRSRRSFTATFYQCTQPSVP